MGSLYRVTCFYAVAKVLAGTAMTGGNCTVQEYKNKTLNFICLFIAVMKIMCFKFNFIFKPKHLCTEFLVALVCIDIFFRLLLYFW